MFTNVLAVRSVKLVIGSFDIDPLLDDVGVGFLDPVGVPCLDKLNI